MLYFYTDSKHNIQDLMDVNRSNQPCNCVYITTANNDNNKGVSAVNQEALKPYPVSVQGA